MSRTISVSAARGLFLLLALSSSAGFAATGDTPITRETAPKVKYKSGKEINFEELLIQGQLKRPELSVVTGDASQGGDGLVRLRENFLDKMTAAAGEEIP